MAYTTDIARRHFRRNWAAFFTDHVFFGLGITFASTSTTLPALAASLTANPVLIGAVASVWSAGWLVPQVFAANYLTNKPRKFPLMFWGQVFTRPVLLLFALWLAFGGARHSSATMALLLVVLAIFMASDAFVALAWLDLLGKALSPRARGRLLGTSQVFTGAAAIGAGELIRHLLGPRGPAYPLNYAAVLGLASLCFGLSTAACALIVEPPEAVAAERISLRAYLPHLVRLWQTDRAFRRVTVVRLLSGLGGLATAFYVVYATAVLNLPPASIGRMAGAVTVGSALSGLVFGAVAGRSGSRRVIQVVTWVQCAVPALALAAHAGAFGPLLPQLYPLLFVLLGLYEGSILLGFLNFILDLAPPGQRPTYMGLTNTLSGVLIFAPVLGGALLARTSYPVLFATALVGTLGGAVLALGLPAHGGVEAAPADA